MHKICVTIDGETQAITKEWLNVSGQIRQLIKEQAKGLKPICLKCGGFLYAVIGTHNITCKKCGLSFELVEKVE